MVKIENLSIKNSINLKVSSEIIDKTKVELDACNNVSNLCICEGKNIDYNGELDVEKSFWN